MAGVSQFVENPISQLEKLSAVGKEVTVQGEAVAVKPLKFTQLVVAIKYLGPILEVVSKLESLGVEEVSLLELMDKVPDALMHIARLCTGKDSAWFDTLESDEGLEVLGTVLEVNKDFFVQRLAPKLEALKARLVGQPAKKIGTPELTTS